MHRRRNFSTRLRTARSRTQRNFRKGFPIMNQPLLQPAVALCFLYCGIVMGMVFDVFNRLYAVGKNIILQYVTDAICTIALGSIFFCTSIQTTGGTLRLYPFLMAGMGFFLEHCTLHAIFNTKHFKRVRKSTSHSV